MKRIILYIVCLVGIGCMHIQNKSEYDLVQNPKSLKESVLSVPDSVATKRQLALKRKVEEVVYLKTQVIDNRLALSVDKKYFTKNNIPPRYYELIVDEFAETNIGLDKMESSGVPVVDLSKAVKRTADFYRQYLKEYKSTGISIEEFNAMNQ